MIQVLSFDISQALKEKLVLEWIYNQNLNFKLKNVVYLIDET
jgi:hypothetical protein